MIRFVLISGLLLAGCATSHRSNPGCWWQHARLDSTVPLFDAKNEIELGTVRSGLITPPRLDGTLRTEGTHVLLEGTLEGEGLVLYTAVDATKHPALHVAERVRLGTAGMLLEGGPVLALGLETGRVLVSVTSEATAHFTPRKPAALVVSCEALTLISGDHPERLITRAGFTPGAPRQLESEVTLRDTPGGEWSGTFHAFTNPVSPLQTQDGWTRIATESDGLLWVGWVPTSSMINAASAQPTEGLTAQAPAPDHSKVISCSHAVKLLINAPGGERTVGDLAPGAPFTLGVSRNGRHLISPRASWFQPAPSIHFFTDDDVSNCSEVAAP